MAPRMSLSTNRQVDPEIWFRIIHSVQGGPSVAPVASYREQLVEIALGPNGAFESGNIGNLRRLAPPDQVLNAAPPGRGDPKPPREPKTPRVVELLRKAIEWQALLESGKVTSQAEIARQQGISSARVTQIMGMLRLAPEIKEHILSIPDAIHRPPFTERMLRSITAVTDLHDQLREFQLFSLFTPNAIIPEMPPTTSR